MSERITSNREKLLKWGAVAGLSTAALTGFNTYTSNAAENLEKDQERAAKIVENDMRNLAVSVVDRLQGSGKECDIQSDEKCYMDAVSESGRSHWRFDFDPSEGTINFGADVSFQSDTMGDVHKGYNVSFELSESLEAGSKISPSNLPDLLDSASPRLINISATSKDVGTVDMAAFNESGKVVEVNSNKVIDGNGFKHETLELFTQQIDNYAD